MAAVTFLGGPLLGCLIALMLSLFARGADHTLRTPLEVEKRLVAAGARVAKAVVAADVAAQIEAGRS